MKILVVDDEKDIQPLFLQRFRKEIKNGEMHFEFACSGEDALKCIQNHLQETFLVLSDINMPGMSGLELLARIKKIERQPPLIVMMITAYGDAENHQKAMHLGADYFMTKPVDFGLLKDKIRTAEV